RGLPRFLRRSLGHAEARAIVADRLLNRERDFLSLIEQRIFAVATNPYHRLLRHAGCELGDLRELVRRSGVEGTLAELYRRGVYLSGDEVKGTIEAKRGSLRFQIAAGDLRNPGAQRHLPESTAGSSGSPRGIILELDSLRDWMPAYRLGFDADGVKEASSTAC